MVYVRELGQKSISLAGYIRPAATAYGSFSSHLRIRIGRRVRLERNFVRVSISNEHNLNLFLVLNREPNTQLNSVLKGNRH